MSTLSSKEGTKTRENRERPRGPVLKGEHLQLVPPTREELATIRAWFYDPPTAQYFNIDEPFFSETDRCALSIRFDFIQARIADSLRRARSLALIGAAPTELGLRWQIAARPTDLMFSIIRKSDRKLVGGIVLHVSIIHCVGTIRTVIGPNFRGQSVGREAKLLLLDYAFGSLALRKVCSDLLRINRANFRVNVACGFRVEGIRRAQAIVNGVACDLISMGVTREQYKKT